MESKREIARRRQLREVAGNVDSGKDLSAMNSHAEARRTLKDRGAPTGSMPTPKSLLFGGVAGEEHCAGAGPSIGKCAIPRLAALARNDNFPRVIPSGARSARVPTQWADEESALLCASAILRASA